MGDHAGILGAVVFILVLVFLKLGVLYLGQAHIICTLGQAVCSETAERCDLWGNHWGGWGEVPTVEMTFFAPPQ